MIVETKPPGTITLTALTALTADERRLLESITIAIRDGGLVSVESARRHFDLEFDGDTKHKRKMRKKSLKMSKQERNRRLLKKTGE